MKSTIIIKFCLLSLVLMIGCDTNKDLSKKSKGVETLGEHYEHLVKKSPDELSYIELYNRTLTLWDVPFEERLVTTSVGEAQVVISGPVDAKPLVLLHGMNASSTMWYPNVGALSKHHRVYAIDYILGPGKSKANVELDSVEQVVNWYFEIFDLLQLEGISLVGASQGGWMATQLTLANTSRFEHLVLLSPAQTFTWIRPSFDMISNLLFMSNPEKEDLPDILSTMSNHVEKLNQLYIDQFFRATKEASLPVLLRQMRPFSDDDIATINIPVLLLIGDDDIINSEASIDNAKQSLPNVKTHIIQNAGHFLSVDQSQETNQKIIDFIKES